MSRAVRVADRPQELGGHVRVAGPGTVLLEAIRYGCAVDARGDDLGVAARRLPRPFDRAPIGERGGAVLPLNRRTTAHARRTYRGADVTPPNASVCDAPALV